MDLPSIEETIGNHTYRAVALPQTQWDKLSEYLSEFLGEPVTSLVKGFDVGDIRELLMGDSGAIALMFASVTQKITTGRLVALRVHMAPSLQVMNDGGEWAELGKQEQELWWAANRRELPGAVWLFLRSQYADFFSGCGGLLPVQKQSVASRSETTSSPAEPSPST